jgi:biopolymer transport protein ExbD
MITRPLDLASKLQPAPRNFDWLFFVNVGVIGLFFSVFGSRFVLAPGLGVDFRLPSVEGAIANAKPPTHVINVINSGQILTNSGQQTMKDLAVWLRAQARTTPSPVLLVRASEGAHVSIIADITSAARRAGFDILFAMEEAKAATAADQKAR